MKASFLYGMTLSQGWNLYKSGCVPSFRYWYRAAFLILLSLANSTLSFYEKRRHNPNRTTLDEIDSPLFILGHWRSGTTLLHNLLACDTKFASPNTYQVFNPDTFLVAQRTRIKIFERLAPSRRPQDSVPISWNLPNEEDIAMCALTPYSPYLALVFPNKAYQLLKYITFRGIPSGHFQAWRDNYVRLIIKLGGFYRKPLLLKSPPNTGRIKILLDLFPTARFVHIVRNPARVIQSCRHLFQAFREEAFHLQPFPTEVQIDRLITLMYRTIYDAYFSEVDLIPKGQFHQLRFEDLLKDPLHEIESMYLTLGLTGYQELVPRLAPQLEAMRNYKPITYPNLEGAFEARIRELFQRQFTEWDYAEDPISRYME